MCGIAGAVSLVPDTTVDAARIARMSECVAHRGPDGEGLWQDPRGIACLAHRRLSVIDLATGAQPMTSEDGRIALVFNGEIYNYRELRKELEADGARFRTTSDTEVLLRLLEREGAACVHRLRGMFAFAAWDARARRLTLARDRIGKKPLYHAQQAGVTYFASSLNAVRAALPSVGEIDLEALDAYLTLGYIPAPLTIHRGVRKLEAGTVMEVDADGARAWRFWDPAPVVAPFEGTLDDATDELERLLGDAVELRLRSDVPLGVFLSGGIDSSLVAALAARRAPDSVRTFSIAMDDAAFDESAHASAVAAHLGTRHDTFHAQADLLATLPELVRHFGEPFGDSSALPTWLLAREARAHVTVALGGDGGDEGFAGYDWYRSAARLSRLVRAVPPRAYAAAGATLAGLTGAGVPMPASMRRAQRGLAILGAPADAARFAALRAGLSADDASRLYARPLAEARAASGAAGLARLRREYERAAGSALRRMRWTDIATYQADELMPKVDVMTMAHGLEARAPLLDHQVVEFALSLPDAYLASPTKGKLILRRLLARHVPEALFDRPKQGFDPPLRRWFAGPASDRLTRLARSERLLDRGWIASAGLAAMVDEHRRGARDHAQRLYTLVVLDEWLART